MNFRNFALVFFASTFLTGCAPSLKPRALSEPEFLATMGAPMKQLPPDVAPSFSFRDYVDAIPEAEWQGHDFSEGKVDYVWQDPSGRYQHVLVSSKETDVYLVLVLGLEEKEVLGFRVMDFKREFGRRPHTP